MLRKCLPGRIVSDFLAYPRKFHYLIYMSEDKTVYLLIRCILPEFQFTFFGQIFIYDFFCFGLNGKYDFILSFLAITCYAVRISCSLYP